MPALNVDQVLRDLTFEEKIQLLSGRDTWSTHPVERLGVPSITVRFRQAYTATLAKANFSWIDD